MKPTWLSWSSGKDSAWTLYQLQQSKDYQITQLFTTVNKKFQRAAMHSTRVDILKAQANAAGLPLQLIEIPDQCNNATYEKIMSQLTQDANAKNIQNMAFGDLFLEDIKHYREQHLANTSVTPHFPLWKQETKKLARTMIENGLKAIITCVDTKQLPAEFVGREFDLALLNDLPNTVDPCGENGEFHTCVYEGPMFSKSLNLETGVTHTDGQFHFIDASL
jgi:uncharacterized protein (TIGR00290 family)